MFFTVRDYFDNSKHLINSNSVCQIKEEGKHFVIELNDCDGTFVRIDEKTFNDIGKLLMRMG